jgi:chromate transporter
LTGVFLGLKAAVIALVVDALLRMARRAVQRRAARLLALAAFIAIALLHVPFPAIVLGAGLIGYLLARSGNTAFADAHDPAALAASSTPVDTQALAGATPRGRRAWRVLALWLPLWFTPVLVAAWLVGPDHVFTELGVFFSKMAVVTFGGAYAVLTYVAQQAVERFGWITPGQMLDGLGLAESTPGPLIMVVQFVGFLAAYQASGEWPLLAGIIGALITVWVTFVPCFLWIFLGAPYVEALRGRIALTSALNAITAAVVGVIANLALWFAIHVLFERVSIWGVPEPGSLLTKPALLTVLALLLLFVFRFGLGPMLLACTLLGAASTLLPS